MCNVQTNEFIEIFALYNGHKNDVLYFNLKYAGAFVEFNYKTH